MQFDRRESSRGPPPDQPKELRRLLKFVSAHSENGVILPALIFIVIRSY